MEKEGRKEGRNNFVEPVKSLPCNNTSRPKVMTEIC
jgi:hypothetical protein